MGHGRSNLGRLGKKNDNDSPLVLIEQSSAFHVYINHSSHNQQHWIIVSLHNVTCHPTQAMFAITSLRSSACQLVDRAQAICHCDMGSLGAGLKLMAEVG